MVRYFPPAGMPSVPRVFSPPLVRWCLVYSRECSHIASQARGGGFSGVPSPWRACRAAAHVPKKKLKPAASCATVRGSTFANATVSIIIEVLLGAPAMLAARAAAMNGS